MGLPGSPESIWAWGVALKRATNLTDLSLLNSSLPSNCLYPTPTPFSFFPNLLYKGNQWANKTESSRVLIWLKNSRQDIGLVSHPHAHPVSFLLLSTSIPTLSPRAKHH